MKKTTKHPDPQDIRIEIIRLLEDFEQLIRNKELRPKVLHLVEALQKFRLLGIAVVSNEMGGTGGGRERILKYFQEHVGAVISGDELLVVSGIQEYARRIRELRVQMGYQIVSGLVIRELVEAGEVLLEDGVKVDVDSYLLIKPENDREAAYRWNMANSIRKKPGLGARDKILEYLRENVGELVNGEELRYVANNKTEWARRVRELRTEFGWPIYSKSTGRDDLPVGVYVLEEDKQSEIHDRKIPDHLRALVLERDRFSCRRCNWSRAKLSKEDPRTMLELHHVVAHRKKGENSEENLVTLCNVCHDEIHKKDKKSEWTIEEVLDWVNNQK